MPYDEMLSVLAATGCDDVLRAAEKGKLFAYRDEVGKRVGYATMELSLGGQLAEAAECAMRAVREARFWNA